MAKPEYRHLGKYQPRKEARDIVTGKCIYLDDHKEPNECAVKIKTSPYAHAMITRIDTSKALALPGVIAIITYENLPEWATKWLQALPPVKPIVDKHVRYVGDAVAVVAAETEDICREAIRLIEVDYDVLQAVFDVQEAGKNGAPQIYPDHFVNNRFGLDLQFGDEVMLHEIKRGNVEEAFKECDFIGGGVCGFENIPAPLAPEPPGMCTIYDPVDDRYLLLATAQSCHTPIMPPDVGRMPRDVKLECKTFNVGGSYGNKEELTPFTMYTCMMARVTGRPSRFFMDKEEQLLIHEMRLGSRMDIRFGMKNGVVHAVKGVWYVNPGICDDAGYCIIGVGLGEMQLAICKCDNWDIETHMFASNRIVSGTVRGFGGQELKSSMMPMVARAMAGANIDPIQFYKDNFVGAGDGYFWRDSRWWICHEVDYKKSIDNTAAKFGWKEKWKGWYVPTKTEGSKAWGVGASVHGNADVGEDNSEAYVRVRPNGQVILQVTAVESGQGQRSNLAKFVAEELNIPYENVQITEASTTANPEEFGFCGSRGTLTTGSSVTRAAEDVRRQMCALAAPILRVSPDEVKTKDGFLFPETKPWNKIPWAAIIPYSTSLTGFGRWMANYRQPNFVINLVEVCVDLETGQVDLERIYAGSDVGQIIDIKDCEMQLHGAIGSAAVDTGLFEESILDEYTGRLMTGNLIDYKWRTFNDFPEFGVNLEESQPNISKYKALGIGEISGAPGAAAVMMAISNAIGKDFVHYPATPASVLKALGKA